jgi:hypothetical protein
MTVKQKMDFKAILNTFIYGSVQNLPVDEPEPPIPQEEG